MRGSRIQHIVDELNGDKIDVIAWDLDTRTHRLVTNCLGLWLFFLSESVIFVILLTTSFCLLGATRPQGLNQGLGFVLTLLLLSSRTAYCAETAVANDDQPLFLRSLLATLGLGVILLLGVVILEWREATHMGIVPQSGYGIACFSTTGIPAFHVLTGVLLLAVIYNNGQRGNYSAEAHWGVAAGIKYWHFVDLAWVFFYPAQSLLG